MIKTASKALLSTEDTNVQFQFVGAKGQSQVFNLLTPYVTIFGKNQLDAFLIMSSVDLGRPEKLRLILKFGLFRIEMLILLFFLVIEKILLDLICYMKENYVYYLKITVEQKSKKQLLVFFFYKKFKLTPLALRV